LTYEELIGNVKEAAPRLNARQAAIQNRERQWKVLRA
jgi:hypothetical protein